MKVHPIRILASLSPIQEDCQIVPAVAGSVWECDVIREGWSKNGVYYSRESLQQLLPLLEGAPVQYYGWGSTKSGHIPQSARIEATGTDENGPAANQGGVLANLCIADVDGRAVIRGYFVATHPILQEQLARHSSMGLGRPPMGLSIDARANTTMGIAEGRAGIVPSEFTAALEVTVVTTPAAGGGLRRLVASSDEEEEKVSKLLIWLNARRAKRNLSGLSQINTQVLQEAVTEIQESGLCESTVLSLAIEWINGGKTEEAVQLLEKMISVESSAPMEALVTKRRSIAADEAPTVTQEAEQILRNLRVMECGAQLNARLQEAKLPAQAEESLRKRFSGRVFEATELQEAVMELKNIIAATQPAPQVSQQPRSVSMGIGPVERHRAAWDVIFGYDHRAADCTLSDAEKQLRTDITRNGRMARPSVLVEEWFDASSPTVVGPNAILHEATSADYPNILSTSMEKRMLQVYNAIPDLSDQLVTVVTDIQNFKTQSRLTMGGFGDIPTVSESDSTDYPTLQKPAEQTTTYSLTKRGGLFPITWEMMMNDDIGQLRSFPQLLAKAAKAKKMKFVYGLVIGGKALTGPNVDTTYDGLTLFHASHGNLGTSALSQSTLYAGRQAIRNQRQYHRATTLGGSYTTTATTLTLASTTGIGAGDFIQVDAEIFRVTSVASATVVNVAIAQCGTTNANHSNGATATILADGIAADRFQLVVPPELEGTAYQILNAEWLPGGNNNDANPLYSDFKAGRIIVQAVNSIYLQGDVNNWYLKADESQVPGIEFGYLRGQVLPEILVQDAPLVGNMFSRDVVTYKLRHVYGGAQVDWRGAYGAIVP
ncbi:MAG: hypothetical protein E6Q97_08865 [Desulfurellales bacterium]|nr:MAG: hypothetical protein E6Q97_08865 [Desulfurellales bacterium]